MIDWARVEELRTEIGDEDFAEVAALFMAELDETVGSLAGLTDTDALRDGFHGLKGAALNLGFAAVADLSAKAESAPSAADLPCIAAACQTASAELLARFPQIAD